MRFHSSSKMTNDSFIHSIALKQPMDTILPSRTTQHDTTPRHQPNPTMPPIECNFKSLHSPNMPLLVASLQKHKDVVGNANIIELLSPNGKDSLKSVPFWTPLAINMQNCVRNCLTNDEKPELLAKYKDSIDSNGNGCCTKICIRECELNL